MIKKEDKITKKTITAHLIAMITLLFSNNLVLAEPSATYKDFMSGGYQEYISGKIERGFYVEQFERINRMTQEHISKRNEITKLVDTSHQASPTSANGIFATATEHRDAAQETVKEVTNQRQQREKTASAALPSGFTYIPYSDGSKAYFKDGLVVRKENERVLDEFGNLSIRNTFNMQYNDKRLLTSYSATVSDKLGNITRLNWYGATYTPDSVYYGTLNTNANKNMLEYHLEEIDPAGNKRVTHYKANSYEGKTASSYHQRIEDEIYGIVDFTRTNVKYLDNHSDRPLSYHEEGIGADGLNYTLDRTATEYNGAGQASSYHEEKTITQVDGLKTKVTTDAKFNYLAGANPFGRDIEESDPEKLLGSIITTTTQNADGSNKTETTTMAYDYDSGLSRAHGSSTFTGQEASWFEYTDNQGHTLSRSTDNTYSYTNPATNQTVIVPENQVIATLKDGNLFKGNSNTQYEIIYGKPMAKQIDESISYYGGKINEDKLIRVENSTNTYSNGLLNNMQRVLDTHKYSTTFSPSIDPERSHARITDISLKYDYDAKSNLIALTQIAGTGSGSGWEYSNEKGWHNPFTSTIDQVYTIILGKPLEISYREEKHYK